MENKPHMFTIIMDTYYRPALLKQAVDALFRQTYDNLEIILVNNGATEETVEYLHQVAASDRRVKLVHLQENQYSHDDPLKLVDVCFNAGLEAATGDYVWYQSDDDLIADDFAEKMVRLFEGNSDCTTAAGLPVSIDIDGQITEPSPRTSNHRPRYMPGRDLALGVVRGDRTLFSAPGSIFTIRREVLGRSGGFHRALELSHLYGIVPFGVTGFDESAHFYWRRHEGQLNLHLSAAGWIGTDETFSLLRDWDIEGRWQIHGADLAREVVSSIEKTTCRTAASWYVRNLYGGRLGASSRILQRMWRQPHFWSCLPIQAVRPLLLAHPIRRRLKGPATRVLKLGARVAGSSGNERP